MAKQQRRKSGNPQRRQASRPQPSNLASSRTGRRQQELLQEQRHDTSSRNRVARIFVGVLAAVVILGTVFGTLSTLALH